jgi:lipoprotein-anchoring transpeptidase ErfK/SrfK
MRIEITLPRNRWKLGVLRLLDGENELMQCPAYGKSDSIAAANSGNPSRDPIKRNGDTPAGEYRGTVEPRAMEPERSYGKWPPIRLNPTGGQASQAHQNGRRGLLIHGGHLDKLGRLRATNGCLRVRDLDIDFILSQARKRGLKEFPVVITEVL